MTTGSFLCTILNKETKQARLWLFVFLENDIQNSSFSLAVWKEHRFKVDAKFSQNISIKFNPASVFF